MHSAEPAVFCATMPGGVSVLVPDSLNLLTPYVLREQEDWFEDEITFVRKFLRPGMAAIDIGANFGVYALTMAQLVGPAGRVWAFEPAHAPAAFLRQSIAANQFWHLNLLELGLSDRTGSAELFGTTNSELNTLNPDPNLAVWSERIELSTIDACQVSLSWPSIDFVKLDAEGEESRILDGGQKFLDAQSPLILFEIKHGATVNFDLIGAFMRRGFGIYYLVPGLDVLAPLLLSSDPEPFQLNLFACKPDRARSLEARGLLSTGAPPVLTAAIPAGTELDWSALEGLPYARRWLLAWRKRSMQYEGDDLNVLALNEFFAAHSPELGSAGLRYAALVRALQHVQHAIERRKTFARLLTLARISWELGRRSTAVQTLSELMRASAVGPLDFGEPFVPVNRRFDSIDPGAAEASWCRAAILEQYEVLRSFSSYFTGLTSLPLLTLAQRLGFADARLARRMMLVRHRLSRVSAGA